MPASFVLSSFAVRICIVKAVAPELVSACRSMGKQVGKPSQLKHLVREAKV
jgi:hypothetical protein